MKKENIEKFVVGVQFNDSIRIHFEPGSFINRQTRRAETGNRTSRGYVEGKYIGFSKDGEKVSLKVNFPFGDRYFIGQEHIYKIEVMGVVRTYSD